MQNISISHNSARNENRRVLEQMISNLKLVLFSFLVEAGAVGKENRIVIAERAVLTMRGTSCQSQSLCVVVHAHRPTTWLKQEDIEP